MKKIYIENFKEVRFVKIKDFIHFHSLLRLWEDCYLATTGKYPKTMFTMASQEILYNYIISSSENEDCISFADLHNDFEQTSVANEILKKEHEQRLSFYCNAYNRKNLDELLEDKYAYSDEKRLNFVFYKFII